jgi:hypothetical protein
LKITSEEQRATNDLSSPFKEKEKGEGEVSHAWRLMEGEGEDSHAWRPMERGGGSHAWRPMEGEGKTPFHLFPLFPLFPPTNFT